MSRTFTSRAAKELKKQHRDLILKIKKALSKYDEYKAEVIIACDEIAQKQAQKMLEAIPIEEINRDKVGIRVKLLRDSGYTTIASIAGIPTYRLESIKGIGSETAQIISKEAQKIVNATKKTVKIKLSTDDKSYESTRLIGALYKCKRIKNPIDKLNSLNKRYGRQAETGLNAIKPATGGLKWLFSSSKKKNSAIDAYESLVELINGDYGKDAYSALDSIRQAEKKLGTDPWKDFENEPIIYFNILEEICPGMLGGDDAVYGLPEELAKSIQSEELHLDGLNCTLRRYQEWGVKYILHQRRVLLGDEMGLGKTIQAIAAFVSLKNTGATHFMVVCPASVLSNWCREIKKMSVLTVIKVHGNSREEAFNDWIKTGGVAVTTYETTEHLRLDEQFKYSMLVIDEAHYIKNPEARRTANVKRISKNAERLLFMTGTALENRVDEMIELIKILQPITASAVSGMTFMASAPQFREKVAPVYYRRKRDDVLTELPELIENKEWCILLPEEERVYETAVMERRFADARRVSWNVDDLKNSSKANRLLEIIDDAEEDGRKVIVFSFFLDTIGKIQGLLKDRCLSPINGSVPPNRRQEIIDEFDKSKPGSVLLAQIQSGGTGLNIQSASVVVICEPQFKPSTENQAISRAYRMGQTRNVLVYRLLCDDTVDERITELLEGKQAIFDAFADKSAVADESMAIDEQTFAGIMKDEADRIVAKHGGNVAQSVV